MPLLNHRQRQNLLRSGAVVCVVVLSFLAYRAYGWPGLAMAATGLVMWTLMHMSRVLLVLRRTAQQPVGAVASAVMLHARLAPGMTLLQVLELTRALGQGEGDANHASERYRWTDGSGAQVHCVFEGGRLMRWELLRP
jgi:hypothetical protein